MRRSARSAVAIGGLLACVTGGVALAQDRPADNMQVLREKVRADKKVVVAALLELTEGEAKAFWPVYNAYQSDMITHYDKLLGLVEQYAKTYRTLSDDQASALLTNYLQLEQDHIALLNAYLPRFQKVLPPRKVARLYQVENKVRALANYELAINIPFVP